MNELPKLLKIILAVLLLSAFSPNAWSTNQASVEYYPTTGNLTVKAEFIPVAGEADPAENAGDKIPVNSDTEQPAYTPNERIVSPMGECYHNGLCLRILGHIISNQNIC